MGGQNQIKFLRDTAPALGMLPPNAPRQAKAPAAPIGLVFGLFGSQFIPRTPAPALQLAQHPARQQITDVAQPRIGGAVG